MPAANLQRCPDCGAPLPATTAAGQCPDCGFAYDQDTRVWRSDATWAGLAARYSIVGVVAGLLVVVLYRLGMGRVPNEMVVAVCGVGAAAAGLLAHRILSGRLTGRFVALTMDGIVVGTRPKRAVIPWDDIQRVFVRGGLARIQRDSTPNLVPLDDIFATTQERQAFLDAANQMLRGQTRGR